jgi:release factor H-coupled RctB family protein
MKKTHIVCSAKSWLDGEAVRQLESTAQLPGMTRVVGMPDLHPGKGTPIGACFLSEGVVYPHLVGNDIGCGIGLWQTSLSGRKSKRDKLVKRLRGLEGPWAGDGDARLQAAGVAKTPFDDALGTIGGGNHFAELQRVERVEDPDRAHQLGLDADALCLTVHSGSRGLGEHILDDHRRTHGADGLPHPSLQADAYLARHDHAMAWAAVNRGIIAERVLDAVRGEATPILDLFHNAVTPCDRDGKTVWLHRKGAAPADAGPVLIPGSRGSWSYLVDPLRPDWESGYSLAHGAGRKWGRSQAKGKLASRYSPQQLERTALGSAVICEDRDLLYQEAPQAYKNVEVVMADMVDAGLARVIAVFRPVVTYKMRRRRDRGEAT